MNNAIVEAINITEEKDFQKKRAEYYRTAMARIFEKFVQFNTAIQESFKSLYENMDYISYTIKNSVKTLSESIYANSIFTLPNIESDDEMDENEDSNDYTEKEDNGKKEEES